MYNNVNACMEPAHACTVTGTCAGEELEEAVFTTGSVSVWGASIQLLLVVRVRQGHSRCSVLHHMMSWV